MVVVVNFIQPCALKTAKEERCSVSAFAAKKLFHH